MVRYRAIEEEDLARELGVGRMNDTFVKHKLFEYARKATLSLCNTFVYAVSRARDGISLTQYQNKKSFEIGQKKIEVSTISTVAPSGRGNATENESMHRLIQHDSERLSKQDYLNLLEKRIKNLESENSILKRKFWKLTYKGTKTVSILLLFVGGTSLLTSYAYNSVILAFVGLGLVLWGAVVFSALPFRQVPASVIYPIMLHTIKTLDYILVSMGYKGRTIFYHLKDQDGQGQGYLFIPYEYTYEIPNHQIVKEKMFYDAPKGLSIVAPSQGLLELFESELDVDFETVDLNYIQEKLSKLLTEDLKLIDNLSIENSEGVTKVKIFGKTSAYICDSINKQTQVGNHLGCPLCSTFGLILSKINGKPMTIKESNVNNDCIQTSYVMLNV